jgi:hypothetical protein
MPRYFLDLTTNGEAHPDYEGTELASPQQALLEALEIIGDIAKDEWSDGASKHFTVAVRDDGTLPPFTISLSLGGAKADKVELPRKPQRIVRSEPPTLLP